MDSRIQCIVFDWDGTLMDSEAQIVSCLHAAIADLQLEPMDDDTVKNVIGLGLKEAIDTLVPGRDDRFHQSFVSFYREHWFRSDASSLFEGVRETLEALKQRNLILGVATGKARRGLEKALGDYRSGITGLAFTADGKILVSIDEDATVKLWDMPAEHLRATVEGGKASEASSIAITP